MRIINPRYGHFLIEEASTYHIAAVDRTTGEMAMIPDITANKDKAMELLDKLSRNQVSPTHLKDVVTDWVTEPYLPEGREPHGAQADPDS